MHQTYESLYESDNVGEIVMTPTTGYPNHFQEMLRKKQHIENFLNIVLSFEGELC